MCESLLLGIHLAGPLEYKQTQQMQSVSFRMVSLCQKYWVATTKYLLLNNFNHLGSLFPFFFREKGGEYMSNSARIDLYMQNEFSKSIIKQQFNKRLVGRDHKKDPTTYSERTGFTNIPPDNNTGRW